MKSRNILIVEDQGIISMDMKRFLESCGYNVPDTVTTGEEALKIAENIDIDLFLIAITLKGQINGIETAHMILENHDIPIVYLTASTDDSTLSKTLKTNPYGYIYKPVDYNNLRFTVETALYKFEIDKNLRDSEEQYRNLAKNLPGIVYRVQLTGKRTMKFFNDMLISLTGYTEEDLTFSNVCSIDKFIEESDRGFVIETVKKAIKEKNDFEVEYRFLCKDGTVKNFLEKGRPVYDKEGNPICIDGVIFDNTEKIKTREELRKERDFNEIILDSQQDTVFVFNPITGKPLKWNAKFREVSGYTDQEIAVMKSPDSWYSREDLELAEKATNDIKKNSIAEATMKLITKSGKTIPFEYKASLVTDEDGKPEYLISVGRDISDRMRIEEQLFKQQEEVHAANEELQSTLEEMEATNDVLQRAQIDLQQSAEQYQQLFMNMTSGVAIYEAVDNGNDFIVIDLNSAGERITNVNRKDIFGKKVTEVFPGVKEFGLFDVFKKVYKSEELIHHPINQYQDAKLQFWADNYVYKLPNGHIVAVFDDLTEKKKAEGKLLEKESRYQLFVQNIQGIAYSSTMDFIPIFFEGDVENITGYIPEDFFAGKPRWDQVIHPEDLENLFDEDEKKLHELPDFKYEREYRIIRKDKSIRWVLDSVQNVNDEKGKPYLLQGMIQDITKRKNVEEQLQIQKDLGISLSSIYDLRGAFYLIFTAAMRVEGIDSGGIYLRDSHGSLILEYATGLSERFVKAVSYYDADSDNVNLILEKKPVYLEYSQLYEKKLNKTINPLFKNEKLCLLGMIPILFMDEVIGCLNVASHSIDAIPQYSKNTLESIASLIGSVVVRLRVEEKVRSSLNEKEILLKEVHHRVKNNMQIISSLLNIKSDDFKNEEDKEIIDDCQNRIRTIALVYEKLYQSEDFSCIDLEDYLTDFVAILKNAYTVTDSKIDVLIEAKDIYLSLDRAITIIQILNEFFSNSLKYAFPDGREGVIRINFSYDNGVYTMIYSDNGVGLSKNFDIKNTDSFGLKLAHELVRNINGTFDFNTDGGLSYTIIFKG